jgi:hypothetical protein
MSWRDGACNGIFGRVSGYSVLRRHYGEYGAAEFVPHGN